VALEKMLTENSDLRCAHLAPVKLKATQHWVRIEGEKVLVRPNTVKRPIVGCTQATVTNKPCTLTVTANQSASFSSLVKIDGHGVCLASATGKTNWSNLVQTDYSVRSAAQNFVGTE
jgi:hypothetical protein